jgi:hypothetical protein
MFYSFPGSIVLSYLGGTFGNSLATLIDSSRTGRIRLPHKNTFHGIRWPIESVDCTITQDSIIKFTKQINTGDIIQLHCLNAELISYKFPNSHCIMLDCDHNDEYYGIQRQWLVNTHPIEISFANILSAWDWIEYNINYYTLSGKNNQHHNVLCLDFKSVIDNFELIEDYLKITFLKQAKEMYILHYQKQMQKFYTKNTNFEFAWNVFNEHGPTAPIENLAKDFVS